MMIGPLKPLEYLWR